MRDLVSAFPATAPPSPVPTRTKWVLEHVLRARRQFPMMLALSGQLSSPPGWMVTVAL